MADNINFPLVIGGALTGWLIVEVYRTDKFTSLVKALIFGLAFALVVFVW